MPAEFRLLEGLLRLIKSRQKVRDKVAHWLWGVSAAFPDAMIMVDPKNVSLMTSTQMENSRNGTLSQADFRINPKHLYLYTYESLKSESSDFHEVTRLIYDLVTPYMAHESDPGRSSRFEMLTKDARLAEFLNQTSPEDQ